MPHSILCLTALSLLLLTGCYLPPLQTDPGLMIVPASGRPNDPGPKPSRKWNGTYQCMIDSMQAGQVTEIKPRIITKWGRPQLRTTDGYCYWTIEINFEPGAVFGMRDVRATAFIRNSRVHFWRYTSTDEVVP